MGRRCGRGWGVLFGGLVGSKGVGDFMRKRKDGLTFKTSILHMIPGLGQTDRTWGGREELRGG